LTHYGLSSRKRPPIVGLTFWVVAYGRFDCNEKIVTRLNVFIKTSTIKNFKDTTSFNRARERDSSAFSVFSQGVKRSHARGFVHSAALPSSRVCIRARSRSLGLHLHEVSLRPSDRGKSAGKWRRTD